MWEKLTLWGFKLKNKVGGVQKNGGVKFPIAPRSNTCLVSEPFINVRYANAFGIRSAPLEQMVNNSRPKWLEQMMSGGVFTICEASNGFFQRSASQIEICTPNSAFNSDLCAIRKIFIE